MWRHLLAIFRPNSPFEHEDAWKRRLKSIQRTWFRAVIGLVATAAIVWLFPSEGTTEYSSWRIGMVAPRDVIAPFLFNVRKNETELAQDRAREQSRVDPVVVPISGEPANSMSRLERFLSNLAKSAVAVPDSGSLHLDLIHESTTDWLLSESSDNVALAREYARAVLEPIYADGVISGDHSGEFRVYFRTRATRFGDEALPERVNIVTDDESGRLVPFSRLRNRDHVRDDLHQIITGRAFSSRLQLSSDALRALYNLIDATLVPNLAYDRRETIRRQAQATAQVALAKRSIFKNERFIENHAVLTSEDIDELNSLIDEQQERQRRIYQWQATLQWAGRAAIALSVVLMLAFYFRAFEPRIWNRPSWLFLCMLLTWLPLLAASFAASNTAVPIYMVPLSLTAMLATVLFSPQVGMALASGGILLAGAILGFNYQVVFIGGVSAAVATSAVRHVRNRNQFLRAMLILPLGIMFAILAVDVTQASSGESMLSHIWPGVVNGVVVPIISMGLLVVCEKFFGITTNLTLLELSDLNSPLLRQLAIQAPGTYTHSIIIANLAETAAEAIGANPLLARVGAYYHDLGKMQRASHFTENQSNMRNPHDKLSPQMSTLIIMTHVKDGLEVARRVGLPKQVSDFIPQHHGTLLIEYFYDKAKKAAGGGVVSEESFRYPGPKPQTKEAAILMMADAVEAAVRSLRERTPSRVQGVVERLIKARLDDDQFSECDLTLQDIEKIAASFLPMLAGAMHERIGYPSTNRALGEQAAAK